MHFRTLLVLSLFSLIIFNSCKKEVTEPDYGSSGVDYVVVSNLIHESVNEIIAVAGGYHGNSDILKLCGAVIDTSAKESGIYKIDYNSNDCSGFSKSGTVTFTVSMPESNTAKTKNGISKITFSSMNFTHQLSNYTYKISGTIDVTNTTGGSIADLIYRTSSKTVTYKLSSDNLLISIDSASNLNWHLRSKPKFELKSDKLVYTMVADTLIDGKNINCWGTNRLGESFINEFDAGYTSSETCGLYNYKAGHIKQTAGNKNIDIAYNVDENGVQISPSYCGYGCKVTYTQNGYTKQQLIAY